MINVWQGIVLPFYVAEAKPPGAWICFAYRCFMVARAETWRGLIFCSRHLELAKGSDIRIEDIRSAAIARYQETKEPTSSIRGDDDV